MSAVLEDKATAARAAIDGAVWIPCTLCQPSKSHMQTLRRGHFDSKKLAELSASVAKVGVLQPILVRVIAAAKVGAPLYEIVAGERRWRASINAKLPAIPTIVKALSDFEVLELQVIENVQRDDLTPLEEAEGFRGLMRAPNGLTGFATVDELAARLGKSKGYVYARLKLCDLVPAAREALVTEQITASTALLIARLPSHQQPEATKKILQGWGGEPATFRQARDLLERDFMLKLGSAIFKITDETLVPAAGSCKACGKRTGANPDLFDDIKSGDVCTDPPCFAKKLDAHRLRLVEIAKDKGQEVITGAAAKGGDFIRLEDSGYNLSSKLATASYGKTVGQLLGKDKPSVLLLEDPHTKALVEVVRRSDALKVVKEKGLVQAKTGGVSDFEAKRNAKAKAENAWRQAVAERAIAAIVSSQYDDADVHAWLMPEAACAMWCRLENEVEKRAEKLLGWEHIDIGYNGNSPAAVKKLEQRVAKLTSAQLDQMFVAMTIAAQAHVSQYDIPREPSRLLRVAIGLGINAEAIKRELAGAAKAKAKKAPAKKAPAKKAAAKKGAKS